MFTSRKRVQKRTKPTDLNRPDFLQALVTEFQDTSDKDAKEQVLANLANFAYDPFNYGYLRDLHVLDLFVDCLESDEDIDGNIVQFGIGGLCNAVADYENRRLVMENPRSIELITRCLSSSVEETALSALTTLMQLIDDTTKQKIVTAPLIQCMHCFAAMTNPRFKNLAEVFLADYCQETDEKVVSESSSFLHIPVPSKKQT